MTRGEKPAGAVRGPVGLPDRLLPILLAVGALLTAVDIVWAFTLAPLVQGAQLAEPVVIGGVQVTTKLLLSQKIFYLHVPVAIASFVAMGFAAFFAVRFLMTRECAYDVRSKTAMEVTLVLIAATMISGDLWTCFEWGVWWVWEPRLTTYFILMLLVIAYFILRNAIDDPERRARFCAVFGIVAFIDAPISFLITRLVPSSIHPVVFRTDSGLPPMMLIPFLLGLFGMLMIAFALYRVAWRVNADALAVEELKERLEEQDARANRAAAEEALARLQARGAAVTSGAAAGDGAGGDGAGARGVSAEAPVVSGATGSSEFGAVSPGAGESDRAYASERGDAAAGEE